MRKSGPFRSIRLCAYTAVGADSGVGGVEAPAGDVSVEVPEIVGWLGILVDRTCQTTNTSERIQTDPRIASRTRIHYHSRGTAASRHWCRIRFFGGDTLLICPSGVTSVP